MNMEEENQVPDTPEAAPSQGADTAEEQQKNETAEPAMFQGPEVDTGPRPYPSFLSHVRRGFWD